MRLCLGNDCKYMFQKHLIIAHTFDGAIHKNDCTFSSILLLLLPCVGNTSNLLRPCGVSAVMCVFVSAHKRARECDYYSCIFASSSHFQRNKSNYAAMAGNCRPNAHHRIVHIGICEPEHAPIQCDQLSVDPITPKMPFGQVKNVNKLVSAHQKPCNEWYSSGAICAKRYRPLADDMI